MLLRTILVLVVLMATACNSRAADIDDAVLAHVVFIWLKEPGNPGDRQKIIDASRQLKAISGVVSVKVGQSIPSDRDVVDDSFDVGLYIEFSSAQALNAYATDALHLKILREILAPLSDHYVVHDFAIE